LSIRGAVITVGLVVALTAGAVIGVDWYRGRVPGHPWDLEKACSGTAYERAAPYEGAGPHPIAVFMPNDAGTLEFERLSPPKGPEWAPGAPQDGAEVQLVACGTVTNAQQSEGQDCSYSQRMTPGRTTLPMARATYQLRIYELRTHREVDSVLLEGLDAACPSYINANITRDRLLSDLTFAQWQQAIGPLVDENR
jgi:hypothetical protein